MILTYQTCIRLYKMPVHVYLVIAPVSCISRELSHISLIQVTAQYRPDIFGCVHKCIHVHTSTNVHALCYIMCMHISVVLVWHSLNFHEAFKFKHTHVHTHIHHTYMYIHIYIIHTCTLYIIHTCAYTCTVPFSEKANNII